MPIIPWLALGGFACFAIAAYIVESEPEAEDHPVIKMLPKAAIFFSIIWIILKIIWFAMAHGGI